MRIFLSVFLLFTMVSSVAVSILQRSQSSIVWELEESQSDDDSTDAKEKESKTETEKDLLAFQKTMSIEIDNSDTFLSKKNIYIHQENLLSSLYKFLPENPPEV